MVGGEGWRGAWEMVGDKSFQALAPNISAICIKLVLLYYSKKFL